MAIEQAKSTVINEAGKIAWSYETIRRLKLELRAVKADNAAMRKEHHELLSDKWKYHDMAKAFTKKLYEQRKRHLKRYGWLYGKYQAAKQLIASLREKNKRRRVRELVRASRNSNEIG